MGSFLAGAALFLVLLLLLLLACPVYYECSIGNGENYARLRFAGGLFRKTFRLEESLAGDPAEEETQREEETAKSTEEEGQGQRVSPEQPICLSTDGTLPEEKGKGASLPLSPGKVPHGEPEEAAQHKAEPEEDGTAHQAEQAEREADSPGWLSVLSYAWDNGTVSLFLAALRRLIRHSWPCEMRLDGEAGFSDPMKTGLMAGAFAAALPGICRVNWQFVRPCFSLQWTMKGFVVPAYLIYTALRFLAAAPVRQTLAYRRGENIKD